MRRKFETEFKRQLIAQIEAGEITAQEAAKHQLSRSLIEYWRDQCRTNALVDRPSKRERRLEAENEKLKAKIGDLYLQMEHIKKLQAWVQRKKKRRYIHNHRQELGSISKACQVAGLASSY